MPRSSEEWRRDQMRSTSFRIRRLRTRSGPADCKPVSVPGKGRWPFIWAKHLCLALATYPRVGRSGQLLPSYLVLLRMGFTLPARITSTAVRSYRTFSPLPPTQAGSPRQGRYIFCGTFRKARFERASPAVSRHAALWRPDFPPAGESKPAVERPPVYRSTLIVASFGW